METLLQKLKDTKNLIAIIIIDKFLNITNFHGFITPDKNYIKELQNVVLKILQSKIDKKNNKPLFNYISFNHKDNIVIIFNYQQEIVALIGSNELKEPIIRNIIKSL